MSLKNLDAECAKTGSALVKNNGSAKEIENSITKALGVLEEQGVYAMFLYLHAREKGKFSEDLMNFLETHVNGDWHQTTNKDLFGKLQKLSENLDNLLFARDILHQALVYGRYHAKAAGAQPKENTKHQENKQGAGS